MNPSRSATSHHRNASTLSLATVDAEREDPTANDRRTTVSKRICSTPGCPEVTEGGRCHTHRKQADRARGTSKERGYDTPGHRKFRRLVLKRDPVCVLCGAVATVADHYPLSRRDLVAQGRNPNDPAAGRGLCASCHGRATATTPGQQGGWNDPGWTAP